MKRTLALALLLLTLSVSVFAQSVTPIPSLMNFQGRLAKSDGTPVLDGTYTIRFSLWDAATGGVEKWNTTNNGVVVRKGVFAVLLSGLNEAAFSGDRWLEIKVGTDTPLSPRQQIVSTAFAFKANLANTVPDGSITAAKLGTGISLPPSGSAGGDLTDRKSVV